MSGSRGITCLETAERLVRNYATDPTTKEYVDNLNIFILPVVNPDGGHNAIHENSVQRKNMKNYCPVTATTGGIGNRNAWGVDLNRNNTVGTLFDGYDGASTSCTSEVFTGPSEASEAEIKNEHWIGDTFKGIKFANNIHTHGGYFMWAPGAYITQGRVTLPAPNIGVEKYFFEVSETILSHIRSLARHGDPAAAHGPDRRRAVLGGRQLGRRELLQARHHRLLVRGRRPADRGQPDDGRDHAVQRRLPAVLRRARARSGGQGAACDRPNPLIVNEGHDSTMEFAEGNFGMIQGALEYHKDATRPADDDRVHRRARRPQAPINYRFNWVNEPSVIHYTTDGSTPTMVNCDTPTGVDAVLQQPGPAPSGRGAARSPASASTTSSGSPTDMKGNQSAVQTQRFLIGGRRAGTVGGTVPATLSLTLGTPATFGAFTPGVDQTYNAVDHGERDLDRR